MSKLLLATSAYKMRYGAGLLSLGRMNSMIEIKNLNKTFKTEVGTVEALKNINFTV